MPTALPRPYWDARSRGEHLDSVFGPDVGHLAVERGLASVSMPRGDGAGPALGLQPVSFRRSPAGSCSAQSATSWVVRGCS